MKMIRPAPLRFFKGAVFEIPTVPLSTPENDLIAGF